MAPIQDEPQSLYHLEKISQYVPLPPAALTSPLPALCASIFSPLLLSYFPPARGIVLGYQNVQLSDSPPASASSKPQSKRRPQTASDSDQSDRSDGDEGNDQPLLLRVIDEYSAPFLWATAEFLVWRPRRNAWIQGRVSHQSSTHITLSHLNAFSVSILKQNMPADWQWHSSTSSYSMTGGSKQWGRDKGGDGEGYWINEDGMPVGDVLNVRIRDFDGRMDGRGKGKGFLRIEGSLLSEEEEKAQRENPVQREKPAGKRKKTKTKGVLRRPSADNVEPTDDAMDIE